MRTKSHKPKDPADRWLTITLTEGEAAELAEEYPLGVPDGQAVTRSIVYAAVAFTQRPPDHELARKAAIAEADREG